MGFLDGEDRESSNIDQTRGTRRDFFFFLGRHKVGTVGGQVFLLFYGRGN